jgi:hypothetical protein
MVVYQIKSAEIDDNNLFEKSLKVISKEELFSNKKSLKINTTDLDYPEVVQVNFTY